MNTESPTTTSTADRHAWSIALALGLLETLLVFTVFYIQGADPVPNVNEPYYLGKAAHFWNPEYAAGDTFLDSADSHLVFYLTCGWLTLLMPLTAVAWIGRITTWWLLAWGWRRMHGAVFEGVIASVRKSDSNPNTNGPSLGWAMLSGRALLAIISAMLFVLLRKEFHMAGEWVIGGFEAKGFAYVLVFLAIEAMIRNRWNHVWWFLGGASAFHVLVGGWAVVAAGIAWLAWGRSRMPLRKMWPSLLGGGVLSLFGLVPALMLNYGVDPAVVAEAHDIYVYRRLTHHLVPSRISRVYTVRFLMLTTLTLTLMMLMPRRIKALRRFSLFMAGVLAIMGVGLILSMLSAKYPAQTASLLRFYWFRLSDVMVPVALALSFSGLTALCWTRRPAVGLPLGLSLCAAGIAAGTYGLSQTLSERELRLFPPAVRMYNEYPFNQYPRASRTLYYESWKDTCRWIAESGEIPADARFITPRLNQTFQWLTARGEVVTWKNIPQDAQAMTDWWKRLRHIHGVHQQPQYWQPYLCLHDNYSQEKVARRLYDLGQEYGAAYAITLRSEPLLPLPVVYPKKISEKTDAWVIYDITVEPQPSPAGQ